MVIARVIVRIRNNSKFAQNYLLLVDSSVQIRSISHATRLFLHRFKNIFWKCSQASRQGQRQSDPFRSGREAASPEVRLHASKERSDSQLVLAESNDHPCISFTRNGEVRLMTGRLETSPKISMGRIVRRQWGANAPLL